MGRKKAEEVDVASPYRNYRGVALRRRLNAFEDGAIISASFEWFAEGAKRGMGGVSGTIRKSSAAVLLVVGPTVFGVPLKAGANGFQLLTSVMLPNPDFRPRA